LDLNISVDEIVTAKTAKSCLEGLIPLSVVRIADFTLCNFVDLFEECLYILPGVRGQNPSHATPPRARREYGLKIERLIWGKSSPSGCGVVQIIVEASGAIVEVSSTAGALESDSRRDQNHQRTSEAY